MRQRFFLMLLVLAVALPATAKCKKGERLVLGQTAVLGGPGLGFETIAVVTKADCLAVLQSSPDGSFAMVQLGPENAGWIATGLVDATLSAEEGAKEIPAEGTKTRILIRETAVRSTPRFDAEATKIIPAAATVTILATSEDGQWMKVSSKTKSGVVSGWIIRFATAEKAVEEGAEPSAGSGAWAVAVAPKAPTRVAAPDDPTRPKSKKIPPKKPGDNTKPNPEVTDDDPPANIPTGPVLGRTQTIYGGLRLADAWIEQYRSDAVGDVYHSYDLQSLGAGVYGGYSFRSSTTPIVVDVRFDGTVNPFMALEFGNSEPVLLFAGHTTASVYAGWRVHQTPSVDVDMGFTPAVAAIINPGFGDAAAPEAKGAFASNLFIDILRPTVTAHSRMGDAGMMVLEVSAVAGAMTFLPDPGATYDERPEADRPALPDLTRAPTGDEPVVEAGDIPPPLPVHLAVGANGRIQYAYPFTDSLLLDIGAEIGIRQAVVQGPGLRTGAYLQANQVDIKASVFAGITFGL